MLYNRDIVWLNVFFTDYHGEGKDGHSLWLLARWTERWMFDRTERCQQELWIHFYRWQHFCSCYVSSIFAMCLFTLFLIFVFCFGSSATFWTRRFNWAHSIRRMRWPWKSRSKLMRTTKMCRWHHSRPNSKHAIWKRFVKHSTRLVWLCHTTAKQTLATDNWAKVMVNAVYKKYFRIVENYLCTFEIGELQQLSRKYWAK